MPWWSDGLLCVWLLLVAVVYFGGFFSPALGAQTAPASAGYAAMLLIAIAVTLTRRLRRSGTQSRRPSSDTEDAHG